MVEYIQATEWVEMMESSFSLISLHYLVNVHFIKVMCTTWAYLVSFPCSKLLRSFCLIAILTNKQSDLFYFFFSPGKKSLICNKFPFQNIIYMNLQVNQYSLSPLLFTRKPIIISFIYWEKLLSVGTFCL